MIMEVSSSRLRVGLLFLLVITAASSFTAHKTYFHAASCTGTDGAAAAVEFGSLKATKTTTTTTTTTTPSSSSSSTSFSILPSQTESKSTNRRAFMAGGTAAIISAAFGTMTVLTERPRIAEAVGPVKIALENPSYSAIPCPPNKPIPGEKAMKGLKGMCVTVKADLAESSPKDLDKVGVYGFVTDSATGESVLANNPDLSTDAGQFSMIETVTTKDKGVEFEFVAAIPKEIDVSAYPEGITPLDFKSLRVISFPGGQQYGAINPCEMNEFSEECEAWESENGPYVRGEFMTRSNSRTKGR